MAELTNHDREMIQKIREQSQVGIMICRDAWFECRPDVNRSVERALELGREPRKFVYHGSEPTAEEWLEMFEVADLLLIDGQGPVIVGHSGVHGPIPVLVGCSWGSWIVDAVESLHKDYVGQPVSLLLKRKEKV